MNQFQLFKPICVDLLKSPSFESLSKLHVLIADSESCLDELQEYLLFPLFIITSNNTRSEKIVFAVAECIQAICSKSTFRVYKIFSDVLLQYLMLVKKIPKSPDGDNASKSDDYESSEEVKLAAVKTIQAVLKSASSEVIQELFSEAQKPIFSHLTFNLLKTAAFEEMRNLKLAAMDCLTELTSKQGLIEDMGSSFMQVFPGICTHMVAVINGSIKQAHLVTQNGVKVFSNLVYLVMKDNRFSKDEPQEAETEWLKKTRTNLDEILGKIMNNPELHWKVKLELISMIDLLINNCSVTLEPSLTLLIKKLVQFTADDNVEVSRKAKEVVESLSLSQLNFDTAVRQNLYDIVTCLPRIITQGITRDQSLVLQVLQGHLTLLGPRLEHTLIFSGLRQRLFKGLLMSAALEPAKVTERDEPFSLLYLREDRVVEAFESCCSSVGRYGSLDDASDYLLQVLRRKDNYSCESVYLMIHVIKGADLNAPTLAAIVAEYSNYLTGLEKSRNDIMLGQLLLEAIGITALKMQHEFGPLLLTSLKPVMEKAGHPDFTSAGVSTLESIAKALDLKSVAHLLEKNADYFAPQLSVQLRNINRYPRAIDLLRALLLLSDIGMDRWLERMVHQALKGLDKSHLVRALPYVQVLELYCKAAYNVRPAGPACAKPLSKTAAEITEEESRRMAAFEAVYKNDQISDDEDEEMAEDAKEVPEEPEDMIDDEKEEPLPPQTNLVGDIMDRCIQLLPQHQSQEDDLYSSIVRAILLSIDILWPYDNFFLPKVHQLWEPLKNQMNSSSILKRRQALDIFVKIVHRCPDFIRERAVKEALPGLITYLESQATSSRSRSNNAHITSQAYKLQKAILAVTGSLVEYLDPHEQPLDAIIQAISQYLHCRQTPEFQNLAKQNLVLIAMYHSQSVKSALGQLIAVQNLTPFTTNKNEGTEFATNVNQLLGIIDSGP